MLVMQAARVAFFLLAPASALTVPDINSLVQRYDKSLSAPEGYSSSWSLDRKRASFEGSSAITEYILKGTKVTQSQVNACASRCDALDQCQSYQVVEFTKKQVACGVYSAILPKSAATLSTGRDGKKVISSYDFVREAKAHPHPTSTKQASSTKAASSSTKVSSTKSSTKGVTSTKASSTSTKAAASPSSSFPASPSGSRLLQYAPCSDTKATVPMFVNAAWAQSSRESGSALNSSLVSQATSAYIVQHGLARNFNTAFSDVYGVIGDDRVLVSANFYLPTDTPTVTKGVASNWYQPKLNLAWNATNDWIGGGDAVAPSSMLLGSQCSTYSLYDSLLDDFIDADRYPNLTNLYFIGHSNGGATMMRYSLVSGSAVVSKAAQFGVTVRFVSANTPEPVYLTTQRVFEVDVASCPRYNSWIYGATSFSRYVEALWTDVSSMFAAWSALDFITLTGTLDTYSRSMFGDSGCEVQLMGGMNRRDRGYAYWAYRNLLAGAASSNDVSDFYGYQNLTTLDGGVTPLNPPEFNHRNCVVEGVQHDAMAMFASECGQASLFSSALPAGSAPLRPT